MAASKRKTSPSPPLLKDIADAVGVSIMTVSNVLRVEKFSGRSLYSEETARKVRETALRLGYTPNRVARAMRTRSTGVVGFVSMNYAAVSNSVENFGVHPFIVGLNHVLTPTGKHVAFVEINEIERRESDELPIALRERFFDGLVIQYGLSKQTWETLDREDIPLIHWDSGLAAANNCICRDERGLTRKLVEKLISLGHKRLSFVANRNVWDVYQSGGSVHHSFSSRYEEFVKVTTENGLEPSTLIGYSVESLAKQLRSEKTTGVIIENGLIDYLPVLRAVSLLNKKVPEDISVGACDIDASLLDRGAEIGGARYNRYEAGRLAGDLLLRRMNTHGLSVSSVDLPIDFTDGKSMGPSRR